MEFLQQVINFFCGTLPSDPPNFIKLLKIESVNCFTFYTKLSKLIDDM
jgi:hypothetical protein